MDTPTNGQTLRDQLKSFASQMGPEHTPPELLEKHLMPNEFLGVLKILNQLNLTRKDGCLLDPMQIKAHLDIYGHTLVPIEYDALTAMDMAYMFHMNKIRKV